MKTMCRTTFAIVLFLVIIAPIKLYGQASDRRAGQAVSVQGLVEVRHPDREGWEPVRLHDSFGNGDIVRVAGRSRADIRLMNDTVIRVDENTSLTFHSPGQDGFSLLEILKGALYFLSNRPQRIKIGTPFVNGTVEGTEFYTRVETGQTRVTMFKGALLLENQKGRLLVRDGQSAVAQAGEAPRFHVVVRPRDAVTWTIYYPPVLECETNREMAGGDHLRTRACRAADLLSLGRADQAIPLLEEIVRERPGYAPALALTAIVALARNENEAAWNISSDALNREPDSATAWMVRSYVLQSRFDLDGAGDAAKRAVRFDPGRALALARLAELELSQGRLDQAMEHADRAAGMNAQLSRAQSILGFAYLSAMDTGRAQETFARALELDQADPLPRLGLGLALIRDGKVEEGRIQLEIAASLDPGNSLIRSYLGKAYYEEKRDKQAADQFALAKKLDPNDPTPYFYDAIRKETINRPVEALQDLEHSMRLNDNRAVYRSRLLLDEDLAARGVDIARIYTDLGFEQRALVEGWKSVNLDPANYSAHRFLSDTYAALPRHEVARVSELLQSQLLQPLNILPVQPHLAESQRFFLQGSGVSGPAFNEYTPLFNRNRLSLLVSGLAGERDTLGDEVVQSGVVNRWSYSIGQFHYQTDGYRDNNDVKTDIYNLFAQVRVSPRTSVQTEIRWGEKHYGDLTVNFFPDDFLENERQKEESRSARVGFHHTFAPGSDLIGSVIYGKMTGDYDETADDSGVPSRLHDEVRTESYTAELQHIMRRQIFGVIVGAGYSSTDRKDRSTDFPPEEKTTEYSNLYLYSQIHYPENLVFIFGSSYDHARGKLADANQVNPKIGLIWSITPFTTFRAAAFRTVTRDFVAKQTIEPTQVAGFNQFFDDPDASRAWRYGAGIDRKFSRDLYGGIEYSWRKLETPWEDQFTVTGTTAIRTADWKERFGSAYIYWTPCPLVSATAEYQYEKFDHGSENQAYFEEIRTHRLPLNISFFHPSGFIARGWLTYVDQKGKFRPQEKLFPWEPSIPGDSSFWVVDAELSYRLPKRYGMVTAGVKNLFDKSFRYQDVDYINPKWIPRRFTFFRFSLSF